MSVRTVKVSNVSAKATVQDIKEFFSFSGEIQCVDLHPEGDQSQTVYVTFKDSQGAETAVLLSGATIVDQSVVIALAPDHNMPDATSPTATSNKNVEAVVSAVHVVTSMLAKGFTLSKDALNKAKAFDEQHQLTSTASAKVASVDQKIGLSGKISAGTTMVNEKVKEMDQKFQVSEKTKSAFASAEQTISSAGSAIMNNRYVMTGTTWVTGAFNRVVAKSPEGSPKKTTPENVSVDKKDDDRALKVPIESTDKDKVHVPAPAMNDPPVAEFAKNDPPVVKSTTNAPPVVESAKNDPSVVSSATNDPPVVKSATNDPPVVESAKNDSPVVKSATNDPPVVESTKNDTPVVESSKNDPPIVKSVTNDPHVVESKNDPPVAKSATNDPHVVELAKSDSPIVKSATNDPSVDESAKNDSPVVKSTTSDTPVVKSATDDPPVVESVKPNA